MSKLIIKNEYEKEEDFKKESYSKMRKGNRNKKSKPKIRKMKDTFWL